MLGDSLRLFGRGAEGTRTLNLITVFDKLPSQVFMCFAGFWSHVELSCFAAKRSSLSHYHCSDIKPKLCKEWFFNDLCRDTLLQIS